MLGFKRVYIYIKLSFQNVKDQLLPFLKVTTSASSEQLGNDQSAT